MTIAPHDNSAIAARQRLDRLEQFLGEDPDNPILRTDAFEAALRCGEWMRAATHLQHAQAQGHDELAWALREGDFWMAQRNWDRAYPVLTDLLARSPVPAGFMHTVLHNLAYIDYRREEYAAGAQRLASLMEESEPPPSHAALQLLWLRILHRLGDLARACRWTAAAESSGALAPQAAGVASLIAVDAADLAAARRWSNIALNANAFTPRSIEALVTQATLALAVQDAVGAKSLADEALHINPAEGRAWSVRAYADLLVGDLQAAHKHFEQALSALPEHIGTWHGQGWTQIMRNELDAAQATFETALAMDRNFAESHGGLAVVLALKKMGHAAQGHIDRAFGLDQTNLSGRYAQAIVNGEVQDAAALQRFARRLLATRAAPMGGQMADWLPGKPPSGSQYEH
ncbi:MAG: Tetratricopeptide 2 repeat protein [Herminiimonas sp.]|nr:Tetratricopeptide 2 repeat protein [Herminiimonas sp.]